jgi:hydrogenase small subunit
MTPFYRRLPDVPGLSVESTVDSIGLALTGVAAAAIGAHAVGSILRRREAGQTHDREMSEQEGTTETSEEGGNDAQDRD